MIRSPVKAVAPAKSAGRTAQVSEANVTTTESKDLKKGARVYWRGDAADGGTVTEKSWDAVTIAWDDGHVAVVHHGDMSEILRTSRSLPQP